MSMLAVWEHGSSILQGDVAFYTQPGFGTSIMYMYVCVYLYACVHKYEHCVLMYVSMLRSAQICM